MKPRTRALWKARLARFPRTFWVLRRGVRALRKGASRIRGTRNVWNHAVEEVESGTEPRGWLDLQLIEEEYVRPRISGDPGVDYLRHFVSRFLGGEPKELGVSLGCGGGNAERALIALGAARRMKGLDASPASIALARDLAHREGLGESLDYEVADLDHLDLRPESVDLVVAKMSLHHFSRLEHVYDQVAGALRPGGFFLINEYVGPDRFQWTDLQLRLANEWLEDLPADLRRRVPVPSIRRPTIREMMDDDPTESVRSSEVLPLLRQRFRILEEKPYGGTVLQPLLGAALPAFDPERPAHRDVLRSLAEKEGRLLDSGELPSDFVFAVAAVES